MFKKIFISGDHTSKELISSISEYLGKKCLNFEIISFPEGVDYPEVAAKITEKVIENPDFCGVLICGSGIGISIAANRRRGIRAALCYSDELALLARKHNNANVLCLGARFLSVPIHLSMIQIFLETSFEGGRHLSRLKKIESLL